MYSTLRSNLSAGLSLDLLVSGKDALRVDRSRQRVLRDDLQHAGKRSREVFSSSPDPD
jgi:predicted proteasome-type protease